MSANNTDKKPENVARGLKAAIHNNRNSEEAKQHAAQRLREMGEDVPADFSIDQDKENDAEADYEEEEEDDDDAGNGKKLDGNRRRGYKATLKNPNVSEKAKQHAKQVLQEADE